MQQIEIRRRGVGLRGDEILARLAVRILRAIDFDRRAVSRRSPVARDVQRLFGHALILGRHRDARVRRFETHH